MSAIAQASSTFSYSDAEVGCHLTTVYNALARHRIRRPPRRRLAEVPAAWLREQYEVQGRSIVDIARELSMSATSVRRGLAEAGIEVDDGRLSAEFDDPNWLAARAGRPSFEVAAELGVSVDAVSRARKRHGMPRRNMPARIQELGDRAWLEDRYVRRRMTHAEIAAEIGCVRSAVTQALQRHGITARPKQPVLYPQLQDVEWLRAQLAEGRSPAQLAAEVGCSRTTVATALRRAGL